MDYKELFESKGFEVFVDFDEIDQEEFFRLHYKGREVGFTEINQVTGKLEIITESPEDHKIVTKLMKGEDIVIWAWYDSANVLKRYDNKGQDIILN